MGSMMIYENENLKPIRNEVRSILLIKEFEKPPKRRSSLDDRIIPKDVQSCVNPVNMKDMDKPCGWKSAPENFQKSFLEKVSEMLIQKAVFEGTQRNTKVVEWKTPEELSRIVDIKLQENGVSQEQILDMLTQIVRFSVKTGHPYFTNQLFSSLDPYGLAGQWVTDALNPSVYTYEVAPVFTLMEIEVLAKMASFIGYTEHDGVFAPGGSIANMYAMIIARHHHFPLMKAKGMNGIGRLVAFTSEDAHYSIVKSAVTLGIGSENLYLVKTDNAGCMNVQDLATQILRARKEGGIPFFVCATGGTTVLGAYDKVAEIADICAQEGLWLHVDAAWGGGALLSTKHRHKLEGIHRADSVTWNPHKLMAAPQQCSVLLTKHKGLLQAANSANATYLFQKDKFYDTKFDTGDKYIQCGRRADVLKLWTMWKAKGSAGFQKHIDTLFSASEWFTKEIKSRPGFRLVAEPQCTNVCFWYEPESLRGKQLEANYDQQIHAVAPKIKERMIKTGSLMITYQPLRNLPNFFRLVLQNSGVTLNDMKYIADKIEELANEL